jgi:MYXO-CTERM domain-containing protein
LPASTDMQAEDGSQYAYTNGGASLEQVLGTTIQAGVDYDLTIWVGNRTNASSSTGFCKTCVFDPEVELISATTDTVLGTATGTTPGVGSWAEWTLVYDAPSSGAPIGEDLEIVLSANANQGDFDNVTLTSSVPEPSTFLFAGAGLLGLGLAARRRQVAK